MSKEARVFVRTSETSHDLYVLENGRYKKVATFGQNVEGLDVPTVNESYVAVEEPKEPAPKKAKKVKGENDE